MSSSTSNNNYTDFLYHFINNSNGVPIYPYITAVTGHRSFAQPGQAEGIPGFTEQDIKEAFKAQLQPMAKLWKDSCNGTAPFVLMTGMSDGADQIAAEAALELDSDLNIKVVAVLPMEEDIYLNTIENKTRFNQLMQSVSFKFTLPLTQNNIGFESELARIGDETEYRRKEQYAILAHFLAVHSHVLFAFWDGIPSTHLVGGTADTVFYKLNGNTESQNHGDLLTYSSVGPVVHLLIPRNNQTNLDYPLDPNLDMSSIPVFYWTRNKKREFENKLKKQNSKQKQTASDSNSETDQLESKYSQWFINCDPLVSVSKLNFRNDLMNSDLRCQTVIADLKDFKEVLAKIGALNKYSVSQFHCNSFFDIFLPQNYRYNSFLKKCKTESYIWLFDISDKQDDNALQNELNSAVPFSRLFGELRPWEDRSARVLVEHYAIADQMALKYQHYSGVIAFLYSSVFAILTFFIGILATFWSIHIYSWAEDPNSFFHFVWTSSNGMKNDYLISCLPKLTWVYIALSVSLIVLYVVAKCLKYHYRYHRFRAVAEALRIQIFWRIAGMRDCVSGYYRSHQIPETEWIRAAVNGLDVFLPNPIETNFAASPMERIQFVKNAWVSGQRRYFIDGKNKRINNLNKASIFTHPGMYIFLAVLFFCLQLKGDIAKLFYTVLRSFLEFALDKNTFDKYYPVNQPDWAIWIFVILGGILSAISGWIIFKTLQLKFKRYKAEAKRFEQVLFPFDRASLLLNSSRSVDNQQKILRQLGTEAISENINWLLTVGEQDLTLPR